MVVNSVTAYPVDNNDHHESMVNEPLARPQELPNDQGWIQELGKKGHTLADIYCDITVMKNDITID